MSLELTDTHCTCNNISYREIIHLVDKHEDVKTVEQLQEYCSCANQCELCRPDIQKIIDYFRK